MSSSSSFVEKKPPHSNPNEGIKFIVLIPYFFHLKVVEGLEEDEDMHSILQEAIDLPELIKKQLAEDETLRAKLSKIIRQTILSFVDNSTIEEKLNEVLESEDFDIKTLVESDKEIKERIIGLVLKYVKGIEIESDSDLSRIIENNVLSDDVIEKMVKENQKEIDVIIREKVLDFVTKEMIANDSDFQEKIMTALENSKIFEKTVENALKNLATNGNFEKVVEQVLEKALKKDNSSLQNRISQTISDKLVSKLAEVAVERLFSGEKRY